MRKWMIVFLLAKQGAGICSLASGMTLREVDLLPIAFIPQPIEPTQ